MHERYPPGWQPPGRLRLLPLLGRDLFRPLLRWQDVPGFHPRRDRRRVRPHPAKHADPRARVRAQATRTPPGGPYDHALFMRNTPSASHVCYPPTWRTPTTHMAKPSLPHARHPLACLGGVVVVCSSSSKPIYSINEANRWMWDEPLRDYVTAIQKGEGQTGKQYTARYLGSMVGDIHRTLLYGGKRATHILEPHLSPTSYTGLPRVRLTNMQSPASASSCAHSVRVACLPRYLRLPGRREEHQRQTPFAVRGRPDCLPHGGSGRRGDRRGGRAHP